MRIVKLQDLRALLDRVIVGQGELVTHLVTAVFAGGPRTHRGAARTRQDPSRQGAGRGAGTALGARAMHARPDAGRRHGRGNLRDRGRRRVDVRISARPGLRAARAGRRDQSRDAAHAIGAARSDAGAAGHACGHFPSPAESVLRAGDAEPDRARRNLPVARGAARPLHVQAHGAVPRSRVAAGACSTCRSMPNPRTRCSRSPGPRTCCGSRNCAARCLLGERCKEAAVDLVVATQPDASGSNSGARRHIRYGASPRALQAVIRAARVRRGDGRPLARRRR